MPRSAISRPGQGTKCQRDQSVLVAEEETVIGIPDIVVAEPVDVNVPLPVVAIRIDD